MKCPNCKHHFHYKQSVVVEHNGEPMSLRELSSVTGLAVSTIQNRYRRGDRGERLIRAVEENAPRRRVVVQTSNVSQEIHVEQSA